MIYSLFGTVDFVDDDFFVVRCNGVGFKCKSDSRTLDDLKLFLDSEVKVFTRMNVRENSLDLFGFKEVENLKLFDLLTSVNGVGPKVALAIISQFSSNELFNIISANNFEILIDVNGVGEKMAKRILLELKDKIKNIPRAEISILSNNKKEALVALESLGYSKNEISPILEKLDYSLSVEELIRKTLAGFGR